MPALTKLPFVETWVDLIQVESVSVANREYVDVVMRSGKNHVISPQENADKFYIAQQVIQMVEKALDKREAAVGQDGA